MANDVALRVNVDANTSGASSKLSKFGGIAKAAALGVAALAAGAVYGGAKLFQMGDASDDANARIRQITKSMDLFGKQNDDVTRRIIKRAEATARATGIDTNSIKATQAKILTFKEIAKSADQAGGIFDRTTQAAIDLGAAGFGTAESNAVSLGKALNDPIKGMSALSRQGVTFSEVEQKRIEKLVESNRLHEAQNTILKAVETQVGGTAKAMSGGWDRAKVVVTQLGERIGRKLVPVVDKAATFMVDKGLPAAARLSAVLKRELGPAFSEVGDFIQTRAIPAARSLVQWYLEKIAPGIRRALVPVLDGAKRAFDKVRASVKDNEPELRKMFEAFKKVAEFVAQRVMPVVGKLTGQHLSNLGTVLDGLIDTIAWIVRRWEDVISVIGRVKDAIDGIKSAINSLPSINLPDIPGIRVSGRGSVAVGAGVGGGVTVNVFGFVGDERTLAQEIRRLLASDARRLGVA